jgi:hypothetical protein
LKERRRGLPRGVFFCYTPGMVITFPVERTERGAQQIAWDKFISARWSGGMDDLPLIIRTPEFERAFMEIVCPNLGS